jgi:hypothetical protein
MADDVAELIVLDDTASLQRPHEDQQAEYVEAQSAAGLIRAVVVPQASRIGVARAPAYVRRSPDPRLFRRGLQTRAWATSVCSNHPVPW